MSRIGKKPIVLPQNVTANLTGQKIEVKGPNGSRCFSTSKEVEINLNEIKCYKAYNHLKI